MKWFKHLVDSGDDPDIDDAISLFGVDGYYVFFRVLEIMSREFDYENPGRNTFSVTFLRKKLRVSWRKTVKILAFFDQKKRIFCKISDGVELGKVELFCPKLRGLCDEHTRKVLGKKSGVNQEQGRIKSHTETEQDTEYLKTTGRGPDFFKNEKGENDLGKRIVAEIKTASDEIETICKKQKIDFDSAKWIGFWLKQNGHPIAILDSINGLICRMIDGDSKKVGNPWGYIEKIMKTKNGNYWERENIKRGRELKYQAVNLQIQELVNQIATNH
jgi:hypothetical protein